MKTPLAVYYASGKLLLFGEYLVLRGTKSLAIPLSTNQRLSLYSLEEEGVLWQVFSEDKRWIEVRFSADLEIITATDEQQALLIQRLLRLIQVQNPSIDLAKKHFQFHIAFNKEFGFGTSSTFLSLLSQWSGVDAYLLLENSFGGSGYDLAAAIEKQAFTYTIKNRVEERFDLSEEVAKHLLFVYLGTKQTSSQEIAKFKSLPTTPAQLQTMDALVDNARNCQSITEWEQWMLESEQLLAEILNVTAVKPRLFADYPYAIKSLGAWGGDFVMATVRDMNEAKAYFKNKGYSLFFEYEELIYS